MKLSDIYLRLDLGKLWRGRDVFSTVRQIEGELFRHKEGRRTLRFELAGKSYFLKYHRGVGWAEIVKNLLQLRKPIVSARNEWQAVKFLENHGVDTMTLAGYGERGLNPAEIESFVITDDLSDTISLEHLGQQWHEKPPTFSTKRALIEKLALISKTMHENGMNHRDYYLCHFLLDKGFVEHNTFSADTELFLIDLHRAMIRQKGSVEQRWLIKDLGALYFSAMDVPLTRRDLIRFAKTYSGLNLRGIASKQGDFWHKVRSRANKMRFADGAAINQGLNPIRSFLQGQKQLNVPFTIQALDQAFECQKVLRLLPGKRLVVEAKSKQHHAVIKLFAAEKKGQRELEREHQGYQLAQEAGVAVPERLFAGYNQQGCLMIAYQFCDNGKTLIQLDAPHRNEQLGALFDCIGKLHAYGIYQDDIHLDNFLSADGKLYLLDLGSIKKQRPGEGLNEKLSLKNVARLIAQFTFDERALLRPHLDQYYRTRGSGYNNTARAYLAKLTNKAWQKRKNNYLKKCFRNCTGTNYHSGASQQWAFRSDFLSGDVATFVAEIEQVIANGEVLKEGNSATVIRAEVAGRQLVIKRYNIKDKRHFLRRCLRASRAAVSWRNANLLEFMGIATAKPLGFIENKVAGLRHTAYFICEYTPAEELLSVYQQRAPTDKELQQLQQIFSYLKQAKVSHGDLKASNFLIDDEGEITLIDLDAMKQHRCKSSFEKAFTKDKARFMANWQDAKIKEALGAIIP
jgi:heptose I phosphotransferase